MLADPDARVVRLGPVDVKRTETAVALYRPARQTAVVLSSALTPQPGRDFQLGILRGKQPPVPAGFLRPSPSGLMGGELDRALLTTSFDAVAVSREPEGGSRQPTEVLMSAPIG